MSQSQKNPWLLLAVLCVAAGVSNIDIFGISYVAPFIETGLKLDNAQIGLLLSGFWLTFAISNYVSGEVADRHQNHKEFLVVVLVLFAFGSVLPALASMFTTLLAARLLMGIFDAGVYQLPQSIVVLDTPPERHGLNMGIVQNLGGALLGVVVAPLLLVHLATTYSWRAAFFVVALPGLICAALVARYVPSHRRRAGVRHEHGAASKGLVRFGSALRIRNVWLSTLISCLMIGYMTITFGFLPLYLIKTAHFPAVRMGIVMSTMGLSGALLGVVLPAASDRMGRKPIMVLSCLLGIGTPLAAMYYSGPLVGLCVLVFAGSAMVGAAPLTYATIPCESAPPESTSSIIGFILALSALVGGVVGPAAAGWIADRWGLGAPLYLAVACCLINTASCVALEESAPRLKKTGETTAAQRLTV